MTVRPNINAFDLAAFTNDLNRPHADLYLTAELAPDTKAWDTDLPTHPRGQCRLCDWKREAWQ